ncbi:hypothetical protein FACS1894191_3700 [Clostridia bacterium]|nr:hypothetical protein FACS1894191_3700 [Clostridia bacterium]
MYNVADTLTLNIPQGRKVTWLADYSGSHTDEIVRVNGGGDFEVTGGQIKNSAGYALSLGSWGAVNITGGSISNVTDEGHSVVFADGAGDSKNVVFWNGGTNAVSVGSTVIHVTFHDANGHMPAFDRDYAVNVTNSYIDNSTSSDSGSGSGGGGGGGGSTTAGPVTKLVSSASSVAGKTNHDNLVNGKVDVRITADAGAKDNYTASTISKQALATKAKFNKYYSNTITVVSLGQQGKFSGPVQIAVKFDPKLNKDNMYFYAYDKATNTYKRIPAPAYWVDKNGFVVYR